MSEASVEPEAPLSQRAVKTPKGLHITKSGPIVIVGPNGAKSKLMSSTRFATPKLVSSCNRWR